MLWFCICSWKVYFQCASYHFIDQVEAIVGKYSQLSFIYYLLRVLWIIVGLRTIFHENISVSITLSVKSHANSN